MQWLKYLGRICAEYRRSCRKHPMFCKRVVDSELHKIQSELGSVRKRNDYEESLGKQSYEYIMYEEYLEALEAAKNGDREECICELIQCIVVCLRCIVHVLRKGCR